jgi:hypothetical protein
MCMHYCKFSIFRKLTSPMRSVLLLSLTSLSAICQPVDKKLSAWCVYVRNPTRGLLSRPTPVRPVPDAISTCAKTPMGLLYKWQKIPGRHCTPDCTGYPEFRCSKKHLGNKVEK